MQRKLRTFEKKRDSTHKVDASASEESIDFTLQRPERDSEECKHIAAADDDSAAVKEESGENICITENGLYLLPKSHPDYATLIKLQLENQVN